MIGRRTDVRADELLARGLVAQTDTVAEVREMVGDPRSGNGARGYRVTVAGGVGVEVLPECGLDLGALWYDNQPIAWRSALGPRGPETAPIGQGWLGRFSGGLLVTCGLDNIGPARDGLGLHGSHHLTPATDVTVTRAADAGIVIEGVVDSAAVYGRQVRLYRRIEIAAGRPEIIVRDRAVNEGVSPAAVPVLYHVNLGAPLVMPGTRIRVGAKRRTTRDEASAAIPWDTYPQPADTIVEAVWEHSDLERDPAGVAAAHVDSEALGLTATLTWDAQALPRFVEWLYPTRKGWVLGVEPTNAPIFGPERDTPHAGAPVLAPGEEQHTGFTFSLTDR